MERYGHHGPVSLDVSHDVGARADELQALPILGVHLSAPSPTLPRVARRPSLPNPKIIRAQLDGTARNLLWRKVPQPEAVAELRKITTDPLLLGEAAGAALGAWRYSPVAGHAGDKVAALLIEAGGDPGAMDKRAAVVQEQLRRDRSTPGIGNPGRNR